MAENLGNLSIVKKILHAGTQSASFKDGSKVFFYFKTRLCDGEKTLIDDSKKFGAGKPLELVLGKKFKMEVWEAIPQRMAVNEVAQFTISKNLVAQISFHFENIKRSKCPTRTTQRSLLWCYDFAARGYWT